MTKLRISLLHLAPVLADIDGNRKLVEAALKVAAEQGADWAVTPELCIPGYLFVEKIGTDWILPQPDPWMKDICQQVKRSSMTVFMAHPDRDPKTQELYNKVFVIDPSGTIIGQHSKIKTLRGPEAWSSPGTDCTPVNCSGLEVGILVCADSYKNDVPQVFKDKGADILVSPASWGPGGCGPDGEWEQRTLDTGLPIIVCNRSGIETDDLDFRGAESVVARDGERLLTATSASSVVLTFDWDLDAMTSLSEDFERVYL